MVRKTLTFTAACASSVRRSSLDAKRFPGPSSEAAFSTDFISSIKTPLRCAHRAPDSSWLHPQQLCSEYGPEPPPGESPGSHSRTPRCPSCYPLHVCMYFPHF
eukprot:Skav202438  [mRNA]  locus=scaffold2957:24738:32810:+ [translate_table: standard]